MDEDIQLLTEEDITAESIRQLFKSAFMKAELDEDGDVRVWTDAGPMIVISVEETRKFLKFMAIYGLKEEAAEADKYAFCNAMNDDVILVRFSVPRSDVLMADYFLSYEEGILPYQIVNTVRMFGQVVVAAIREHDVTELVE